jgi:hypothetical protein
MKIQQVIFSYFNINNTFISTFNKIYLNAFCSSINNN